MTLQTDVRTAGRMDGRGRVRGEYHNIPAFSSGIKTFQSTDSTAESIECKL